MNAEETISEMLQDAGGTEKGDITCTAVFRYAAAHRIAPIDLGKAADAMSVKIRECQLGLMKKQKQKESPASVESALAQALQERAGGKTLSCAEVWQIAADRGISRPEAGQACDALGIKVSPCQLGLF